eukprot:TRINITY_DN32193_c0_g1_i1.p1 TRINITY_DN32193_c0_g1~~TRINITY_DN32193_c0_g1_i1.p1  ORF type:complete len:208 (-),score=3.14 TRINITY_DN32193_c0_g1_i1:342-965(-)
MGDEIPDRIISMLADYNLLEVMRPASQHDHMKTLSQAMLTVTRALQPLLSGTRAKQEGGWRKAFEELADTEYNAARAMQSAGREDRRASVKDEQGQFASAGAADEREKLAVMIQYLLWMGNKMHHQARVNLPAFLSVLRAVLLVLAQREEQREKEGKPPGNATEAQEAGAEPTSQQTVSCVLREVADGISKHLKWHFPPTSFWHCLD